jgi:uncharacterized protein YeeX (DUF496 family)
MTNKISKEAILEIIKDLNKKVKDLEIRVSILEELVDEEALNKSYEDIE